MILLIYVLIPLLPLLSAVLIAALGRRLGENSRKVGTTAIALSFLCSGIAFAHMLVQRQPTSMTLYRLMQSGDLTVDVTIAMGPWSAMVLLLVTGVSFVVHAYSSRYMIGDERYERFFALTSLFTFAMIALVMSGDLLTMFMAWELMGVCSYLLISHQADRTAACHAATKAFLVNAIADLGFLMGIVLAFVTFGTLDITEILRLAPEQVSTTLSVFGWTGGDDSPSVITVLTLCLFVGCMGKSAQMPFHVWLPQAMEAPTPVSALIHAATMVNAGPFLLIRLSPLFLLSPSTMTLVAVIGGATALCAGLISVTQSDIKKTLAFSTVSQIGFMVFACGVGAFVAAAFHLLAHGLIKGYLFLSTGSLLDPSHDDDHAHETQASSRPTFAMAAGAFVLACVAPIVFFSGPYGGLWMAHGSKVAANAFHAIGLATVFVAGVMSVRGVASVFQSRPLPTVQPRIFSAFHISVVAVVGSLLLLLLCWFWGAFRTFLMEQWLVPVGVEPAEASTVTSTWLLTSMVVGLAGWGLGCAVPTGFRFHKLLPPSIRRRAYVLFVSQMYFDPIYQAVIVRPSVGAARWACRVLDEGVIAKGIGLAATGCLLLAGWVWKVVDVRGAMPASRRATGLGGHSDQGESIVHSRAGDVSARPLQHQLLIQILWLIAAMTLFYWAVLSP